MYHFYRTLLCVALLFLYCVVGNLIDKMLEKQDNFTTAAAYQSARNAEELLDNAQSCLPFIRTPSSTMANPLPTVLPRGIAHSLPTCGKTRCNDRGTCVFPPGGGDLVCECNLGYRGKSCEETFNKALSLPLTLSVLAIIFGLLILAFIFAKIRQRQKKAQRRRLAQKHSYKIAV